MSIYNYFINRKRHKKPQQVEIFANKLDYQQVAELYNYNKSGKTVGQVVLVKMGCNNNI
jgi:hypothetical protein